KLHNNKNERTRNRLSDQWGGNAVCGDRIGSPRGRSGRGRKFYDDGFRYKNGNHFWGWFQSGYRGFREVVLGRKTLADRGEPLHDRLSKYGAGKKTGEFCLSLSRKDHSYRPYGIRSEEHTSEL